MSEVLRVVGGIAGIGGISLGILLLVYRDLVRDLIRHRAFRALSSDQATLLLGAAVVLTFVIAILGIFAGLASGGGAWRFILLVGILLVFVLAVVMVGGRVFATHRTGHEADETVFGKVARLVAADRLDEADRRLLQVPNADRLDARFWYWKSRVALARDNVPAALGYVEEAVKREPRDELSVALQIKLLVLSPKKGDRARARRLAEESRGISTDLDVWVGSLTAEGLLGPGVRTNTEIDAKCPFPAGARAGGLELREDR